MIGGKIYPYLSIVIPGRNDNYGGDQVARLNFSMSALMDQLERYKIASEIVLVDWNPPEDRPPFHSLFQWPAKSAVCTVRSITVPREYHGRYPHSDKRDFNGPTSFNVGFRRANGLFILPKSSDTIFSEELMQFLSRRELSLTKVYRANRCDVPEETLSLTLPSVNEKLSYCRSHVLREYGYHPPASAFPILHTDASGDFQLTYRDNLFAIRGYWERDVSGSHNDSLVQYALFCNGIQEIRLPPPAHVFKVTHAQQTTRSSIDNGGSKSLRRGVPTLSWDEAATIIEKMVARQCSNILNGEDWGLGNDELPETVIF